MANVIHDADSDSASDDDVDLDMDNDVPEADSQAELERLQKITESQPYLYDGHVDYINALRRSGELEKLRSARQIMNKQFPLSPKMWLEWIKDERSISEEKSYITQLFESAVKEYVSFDLWFEYCQYIIGVAQTPEAARSVFERALTSVGLQADKGALIWDIYREYELLILGSMASSGMTADVQRAVDDQTEKVIKLFKRQLVLPLRGMDNTLKDYLEFTNTTALDQNLERQRGAAVERLAALDPLEDELTEGDGTHLDAYKEYIAQERKWKDPFRIQCIYERAICENPLDKDLWIEYLDFVDRELKIRDVAVAVHEKAVRNCPWVTKFWQRLLLALERAQATAEVLEQCFERALESGYSADSEGCELWLTRAYQMCRAVNAGGTFHHVMAHLSRGCDLLSKQFGSPDQWDAYGKYRKEWALLSAKRATDITKARELWDAFLKEGSARNASSWLEYVTLERQFGTVEQTRRLLFMAVNSVTDFPEVVCHALVDFERVEGTLELLDAAELRVEAQLKRIAERQANQKVASKKWQDDAKRKPEARGWKKQMPQQQHTSPKSEPTLVLTPYLSRARKMQDTDEMMEEGDALAAENSISRKRHTDNGEVNQQSPKKSRISQPVSNNEPSRDEQGFAIPSAPVSGKKPFPGRTSAKPVENINKTVFLSNLSYATTEEELIQLFGVCGDIVSVRFPGNKPGVASRGFAYLTFAAASSAQKCLEMDRTPLHDRPAYVSSYSEDKQHRRQAFQFKSGLEKNKLFIRNLPFDIDEANLRTMYEPYGALKSVRLVTYRTGKSKGIAFVEYETDEAAAKALQKTDNEIVGGQPISVALSDPPARRQTLPVLQGQGHTTSYDPQARRSHSKVDLMPRATTVRTPTDAAVKPGASAISSTGTKGKDDSVKVMSEVEKPSSAAVGAKKSNDEFRKMFLK